MASGSHDTDGGRWKMSIACRRQKTRRGFLVLSVAACVVGPRTVDMATLVSPQPWPLSIVGSVFLATSLVTKRGTPFVFGSLALVFAAWSAEILPLDPRPEPTLLAHAFIIPMLVAGLVFSDAAASLWRQAAALLMFAEELRLSATYVESPLVPLLYAILVGACDFAIARWRSTTMFPLLVVASAVLVEANGLWLGYQMASARFTWRGSSTLVASWLFMLLGLHLSAWKGGMVQILQTRIFGRPSA